MKTKITILVFLAICSSNLFSTNYVVNTNADSGAGSLRQAITDANLDVSTPHTITFASSYSITLLSALLGISKTTTIDGQTNTINIVGYSSSINSLTNSAVLTLNNLIFNNFISSYSANATATGCTFKNTANAVKVNAVTFSATNCTFDSNSGSATLGASVTAASSSAVIQLSGCTITNNTGVPAVYHKGVGTGTLTLTNCTVSGNTSTTGPAIYNAGNGSGSSLSISNSIIKNNTNSSASVYGGGIGSGAVTTISNCQISGNSAARGGGMALLAGGATAKSKLTMSGCTISGNTITGTYGCGIYLQGVTSNYTDNCTITNCTISGNYTSVASSVGGGIEIGAGGNTSWTPTITLTNCSITGNWVQGNPTNSTNAGGGIDVAKGTAVVNYCIIAGNNSNSSSASKDLASATSTTGRNLYGGSPNWNSTTTTGNVNLTADISTILNTTLTDNGGTTALPDGSYVKTHALYAGTSSQTAIDPDASGLSGLQTTDQRGTNRDALPDIGAYESMLPGVPTSVTVSSNNVSGQLSVAFTAPSVSTKGGAAISNYKYSTDGGTTFTALSSPQTSSPFVLSGLTNGTPYNVQIRALNSNGDGVPCATKTATPNVATISGAALATAFTTTYGTASDPQSFSISGANLAGPITATAPTGFEVSSDGTSYGATATYSRSLVDFTASGTVYIRLKATASVSGSYNSKNIVLSTSGATSVDITTAASGNAVSAKALTITANDVHKTYGASALSDASGSTAFTSNGLANSESIGTITVAYATGAGSGNDVADAAGTYPNKVTASAAVGGTFSTGNYTITYTAGSIIVDKASQSITFNTLPVGKTTADADFAPGASSATSGINAITYSSSNTNVATIVNGNIHIVGVGTTSITASQSSSANYNPAADVSQSLTITTSSTSDNFRSNASGNWGTAATWQSSSDNSNWGAATLVPTSSAASVTIMNGHTVSVAVNATAGALTLNAGSVLNINAGVQFTVTGALSNSGTVNLRSTKTEGSATLLTSGTVSTGTYNVEQYLDGVRNWYISSPLSNATAPLGNTYFNYVEAGTNVDLTNSGTAYWKPVYPGDSFTAGVGYISKPTNAGLITFSTTTGKINTGDVTVNLTKAGAVKTGFNLCGNPFPANLTFTDAIATAANAIQSVWYRTASYDNGLSKYVYSFNTFNVLGGPSVSVPVGTTGVIPPMQAFWIRANTANADISSLVLNNSMCTADVSSNPLKISTAKYTNQQVLRILLSSGTNNDEAVLYSNPNASNAYDGYDSPKMFNNSASIAEIYSIAGAENLAINGLNTIPYDTEIALGFNTQTAGIFSIKASQISNFEPGTQVILKDYLNPISPVTADLSDGSSYSFSSDASTNNTSRFALIFHSPQVATGINPAENTNVWISTNANNEIGINGITGEINVELYNAVGQKILTKNLTKANVQLGTSFAPGVYMISVSAGGQKITRKVIVD